MKNDIAITVKNLDIVYKELNKVSIRKSLFKKKNKSVYHKAVNDVSFEIETGKIVGIIGKNGSGKSTLLRAIAGIFSADKGEIDLHGNTISLLSIGIGFNKKLTGRENIYLSGLLLGFPEDVIKSKEKEIIKFAGLKEYIDKPVSTYSSGMYSKLAFSITAILETEIMLIDEVLSVGDSKFKKKSYNKMKELIEKEDRTVIIVSHSAQTIKDLCDEVIWINDGHLIKQGNCKEIIDEYEKFMES